MSPGDALVVGGVVVEAAVQDADEAVAQGASAAWWVSPADRRAS